MAEATTSVRKEPAGRPTYGVALLATTWRFGLAFLRGIGITVVRWRNWVTAADKAHLIVAGATARDRASHDRWCLLRRRATWVTLAAAAVFMVWLTKRIGPVAPAVGGLAVAAGLVWAGRPPELVVPKEVTALRPVVTGDTIRQIVASATTGIRAEDWQRIRVLGPGLTWDASRTWWSIRIDLPGTLPGSSVVKAFGGLMSGLGVGRSQLIVRVDQENEGIVTLSGTLTDPWATPPRPTPLAGAPVWSIWDPIPVAADAQGRTVLVSLLFTGWLIGAIPRRGKTNLARLLMLAVALDEHADLAVWDLKGGGDWRMFEPMALDSGFGRGDTVIARLLGFLQLVQQEVDRRSEVIAGLPASRCPQGQLTRDLAADPDLDMRPLVILVDEVHWALKHRKHGRDICSAIEDLVKAGQYVGIWFILATQRPDVESIPSSIRDVLGTRAALKCMTRQSSETILGTEAYKMGWNAATLSNRPGVAIIIGDDAIGGDEVEPGIRRIHLCDTPEATVIAGRALALRVAAGRVDAGRLALVAESSAPSTPSMALLDAVRKIQGDRQFVASAEVLETLNGEGYADLRIGGRPWTFASLGAQMRRLDRPSSKQAALEGRMAYDARPQIPRNVLTSRDE